MVSMYTVTKVVPGLQIEMVPGRRTYRARGHARGMAGYVNTQQSDPKLAAKVALEWFAKWVVSAKRTKEDQTMARAAALVAESYRPRQESAKLDFLKRWHAIAGIHGLGQMEAKDVTGKYLRAFASARGDIASSTTKKDWDTIRPVLRIAKEEGWVDTIPDTPKVLVDKNPRVPFTLKEYRALQAACTDQEVRDFMDLIVLCLLRPYEVLRLAVGDIGDSGSTMRFRVQRKTGPQHAPLPVRFETARDALRRRMASAGPSGRLFPRPPEWFPRRFAEVMKAAGITAPPKPLIRDSWSLRATGICLEIQRQRRKRGAADLLQIARWAGTSVSRIDGHYAAFLG
jgi:hypothetical protein